MAIQFSQSLQYPEEYLIEADQNPMGDTNLHTNLIEYLKNVLKWLYRQENWLVFSNLNIHHPTIRNSKHYIVPDIALIKTTLPRDEELRLENWDATRQAPAVVFEISSKGTGPQDIGTTENDKPAIYARLGVKEYFAYDPNQPPVWGQAEGVRLRGWRYQSGTLTALEPDPTGRLWSEELASYLVPDGYRLTLADQQGQTRLTREESLERQLNELLRQAGQEPTS